MQSAYSPPSRSARSALVRHWLRERTPGWRKKLSINAFGATLTFLVFVVVLVAKAPTSLLIAVVVPLMILVMVFIHRQYQASARHLAVREDCCHSRRRAARSA